MGVLMRLRELARPIAGMVLRLAAIASVLVGGRWAAFTVQDIGAVSSSARSVHDDALWLSHLWVDGRKNDADVQALADTLRTTGIKDLFVHSGPLRDDGTLDAALRPRARWFVGEVHRLLPGVRVQAWLGDEVEPIGRMSLQSAATRDRIAVSIRSVLGDGFDGVHLDFEPVGDADPGYLSLLDQVRPIVHADRDDVLSVSAEQVEPAPGLRWLMEAAVGHDSWWSAAYLHQVATRVDEIAVMSYDTALWSSSAYTGFVRDETTTALAATPPNVTLLMGAPAFRAHSLGHVSAAETVPAAIRGIRLGLPNGTPRNHPFGIALYMDYYATASDWAAYRADWLR